MQYASNITYMWRSLYSASNGQLITNTAGYIPMLILKLRTRVSRVVVVGASRVFQFSSLRKINTYRSKRCMVRSLADIRYITEDLRRGKPRRWFPLNKIIRHTKQREKIIFSLDLSKVTSRPSSFCIQRQYRVSKSSGRRRHAERRHLLLRINRHRHRHYICFSSKVLLKSVDKLQSSIKYAVGNSS